MSYRPTMAAGKKDKGIWGLKQWGEPLPGVDVGAETWMTAPATHQPCDLRISPSVLTKHLGWATPSSFPNPPAALFLRWPTWSMRSAVGLPLPASTHFETMEKKAVSAEETFSVLPFCTHHTNWQNSQKSPINLSSTINLQCLDKTFRKWVEVSQSMRQIPYNLQNTTEKQPTLGLNYCGLSKSIQSNMQGDKAILPGRQIFQITGS